MDSGTLSQGAEGQNSGVGYHCSCHFSLVARHGMLERTLGGPQLGRLRWARPVRDNIHERPSVERGRGLMPLEVLSLAEWEADRSSSRDPSV
jgi:hypothetical protein